MALNALSFRPCLAALATAAALASAGAQATPVSGNFGRGGFDTVVFTVVAPATVDMVYTGGYGDPTFSLFDGSGAHLITNDDSNGLYSHLTQTLSSGVYSLLVSYCCHIVNHVDPQYTGFSNTDGFNYGSYWVGGTSTLASAQAYLMNSGYPYADGSAYALTISNVELGRNDVPEPASLALVGVALLGARLAWRRRAVPE